MNMVIGSVLSSTHVFGVIFGEAVTRYLTLLISIAFLQLNGLNKNNNLLLLFFKLSDLKGLLKEISSKIK